MAKQAIHECGWKPEGFTRKKLSLLDIDCLLDEVRQRMASHFENYGDGIFLHPHEIVGCMFGQLKKLSEAADASIYKKENPLGDFKERCIKTLLAIIVGTASVEKLIQLRERIDETQSSVKPNVWGALADCDQSDLIRLINELIDDAEQAEDAGDFTLHVQKLFK